jgi:AcrR family transcriptional regulator
LPSQSARTVSRWAGVPASDRKAERRALLLDAAFDLLGTEGWAGTSVRAVCAAARLNPRYFYESFDDLDALVVAVYDRVVADLAAAVAEAQAAAPPDPASQAHASIDRILRFVDEDRRRGRVLYVEAIGNEALNRRRRETGLRLVELVERDAAERGHLPPGEHIGRVGAALLVGGFTEVLSEWLDGRIGVSRQQLAKDAAALCLALAAEGARIARRR